MINIPGYHIKDVVFKSERSTIFRARRNADEVAVVIKLLNREYPSEEEYSEFFREFEITEKLKSQGIIEVFSFEKINNSPAIIMQDTGGDAVDKLLVTKKLNLVEKLSLVVQMIDSLNQVHLQNVVHKDVNPSNFIWNPETNTVKIIDFGIAAELAHENNVFESTTVLEGTLNYIAPEQTGRISRPIDNRSDLYSFGVLLYQLFTGELPFSFDGEAEIVHSHLAKVPIAPVERNPELPIIISEIIMKLLSKDAEQRYQSASGLKLDLLTCFENCTADGKIPDFIIGRKDVSTRFTIPYKLYGREEELKALLSAFKNVSVKNPELFLISGYSGVGKSSLVNEIRNSVHIKNGYFVSGKFHQFDSGVPYSAIIHAFRDLIRLLLTGSREKLEMWKSAICNELGNNVQVIIDIIPELEQITGPQQRIPDLNPVEAQNRFLLTFKNFLSVFEKNGHPLVVFIDDLQWSDPSTLELLKHLLMVRGLYTVLFIVAYRDNEVTEGDPLLRFLEDIRNDSNNTQLIKSHINLKPVAISTIKEIVADTCHCDQERAGPLASVIYQKTNGNPFFVNKVLQSLYQQGAFSLNQESGAWEWDIDKVNSVGISDNVVDFLVKHIESLPEETVEILKLAACIGNKFDLFIISKVLKRTFNDIVKEVWISVEKGFIHAVDGSQRLLKYLKNPRMTRIYFKFNHDRISQAVRTLIGDKMKIQMNVQIGNALLESYLASGSDISIFDVVNHLNQGDLVSMGFEERKKLSDLNITAGNSANKATAYSAAYTYFNIAKDLLNDTEWSLQKEQWFSLSLSQATVALLSGNLSDAEIICDTIKKSVSSSIEIGKITNVKVLLLEFMGRHIEAVDEIRQCLRLFGVVLPDDPADVQTKIQEGIGKMQGFIRSITVEKMVDLPEMKDPEKLMAMQLLFNVIPPALLTNPPVYILASLTMFELSMVYGTTALSCKNFVDCGVIQCTMIGDYVTGYKLGEAAFALIKKFNAETLKSSTYFVFTFISHWRNHFKEDLDYYALAYKSGLETGDIQHAAYAIAHKVFLQSYTGKNLEDCLSDTRNTISFLSEHQTATPLILTRIIELQIEKYFVAPGDDKERGLQDREKQLMDALEKMHNIAFVARVFHYNALFHIIHGDIDAANQYCQMAEKIAFAGLSDFPFPAWYLFEIIIIARKWNSTPVNEYEQLTIKLSEKVGKLQVYMESAPSNFAHLYHIASALIAVIQKKPLETILEHFKNAMNTFLKDDFTQMKALCCELQGTFWLERGEQTIGKAYIKEAYYLYQKWGATRKLCIMEATYPHYINGTDSGLTNTRTRATHSNGGNDLDVTSIIKSTQVISGEIKIEKLLDRLMHTIIENAGAEHGCLLLKNECDNKLYIEAIKLAGPEKIDVLPSLHYTQSNILCHEIIQYVENTMEFLVIDDAYTDSKYRNMPYILNNKIKSVICMPVILQNKFKGIVYLENNLSSGVFTTKRIEMLKIIASQASISIENARLYENLEEKVRERTSQLRDANEKLQELSLHDPLTNLFNRRYTYDHIAQYTDKYLKEKSWLLKKMNKRDKSIEHTVIGVYLIDIDFFKMVNDSYGHQAGDTVLVKIANVLKSLIRTDDFIVRWGGEEFLIILNNTKPEYLGTFAQKVITAIQETEIVLSDGTKLYLTCSLGFSKLPIDNENPDLINLEQTINISDYALYCAKESGRNRAAFFNFKKNTFDDVFLKQQLTQLSKCSKNDTEYFSIDFV
jgi:diguanylate cyclase (GGDEF)-like protein